MPGGVAFENFEVRQRYVPGATFVFGIAPMEPRDLYKGSGTLKAWTDARSPADNNDKGPANAADGKSAK